MSNSGKSIRLKRLFGKNPSRCVIVPMDHGVTVGPVPGLENIVHMVSNIAQSGADAVVLHKGLIPACCAALGKDTALIMHLSASSRFYEGGNSKVLVASVEEAICAGADAVSIHVTLGDPAENEMLRDFGRIGKAASRWGMPLLAMMYVRGPGIDNPHDAAALKHAARLGSELGADMVKIPYCGTVDSLREIIASCPVPVVLAGGEKVHSDAEVLTLAQECMQAGAVGLSIGRNIFQHTYPDKMANALCAIVHEGKSAEEALACLQ